MDLGEVVEINYPDLALTTPSPPADNTKKLNCGRIHPSLNKEGKLSFSTFICLFFKVIPADAEFQNIGVPFYFVLRICYFTKK